MKVDKRNTVTKKDLEIEEPDDNDFVKQRQWNEENSSGTGIKVEKSAGAGIFSTCDSTRESLTDFT